MNRFNQISKKDAILSFLGIVLTFILATFIPEQTIAGDGNIPPRIYISGVLNSNELKIVVAKKYSEGFRITFLTPDVKNSSFSGYIVIMEKK